MRRIGALSCGKRFSGTRVASAGCSGNGAWQPVTFDLAVLPDWNGTIWIHGPGP